MLRNNRAEMPFGVMGGHYQSFGHMHLISKYLDFDLDLQETIDLPRLFPLPGSNKVEVEVGFPQTTLDALKAKGHKLVQSTKPIGGAQAIHLNWSNNTLTGASDPRKDGCALGY